MRIFLPVCLSLLSLAIFAFASHPASAKQVTVVLSKSQVSSVCGNKSYCEKSCGTNGQYTCTFGCGTKGCSGQCANCPTGHLASSINGVLKAIGEGLTQTARGSARTTSPTGTGPNEVKSTIKAPRDASTGQATGRRIYSPIR